MKFRTVIAAASAAFFIFVATVAFADYTIKDGNGNFQTVMAFICQTSKICPGHVIVDSGGNEKATSANPLVGDVQKFGGVAVNTGTGAGGTGTPRVTVSNDSNVIPWDGTTVPKVQPGSTAPALGDASLTVAISPNGDACSASSQPKSSVSVSITSATTTQLVALSGSTKISVCGWSLSSPEATTVPTFAFEYGTGSNCGTGTTTLTGTFGAGTATTAGIVNYTAGGTPGTEFSTASGNALCVVTTGTVNLQGYVTYVQR